MLDFRVDTFLAVCRCMSFTRAAAALHITQPAVSQHIRALEAQYGVRFFSFEGKKLTLTDAGRLFLRTATTMRHDAQHLRDALGSLSGGGRRLVFGATLTIGEYVMPAPLARLLAAEPNVSLRMVVANTAELLRGLDRGDIDFAIVEGFFEKSEYDSLSYLTERYVAVCAPGYRFRQPVHTLEDLLGERLLTREPGSGTREILERRLREHNLTVRDFRAVTEIGSLNAIKALVRMGQGVAFLYEPTVRAELESGALREIALSGFPVLHDFTFLWRKSSVFAQTYREIFDLLRTASDRKREEA
ncbi:LysR family transcriptional regulator [Intestinibacillus sp. NTUH-41-i26]|uniref:LysR family transcriptional regulator n=1 Tax=Butyricicoccaceae TaxID=3085642 RepID=UPI000D1F753B|nr:MULTISPECIES: LysR family transcriptional regulator [Butyricicoccaceae]WOC75310.1 LysR family transcriptional regulator [Intestinibacillus sp. NTUH-41-i26]